METTRHKAYKDALFDTIHRELSGCLGCSPTMMSDDEGDHAPFLSERPWKMQQVALRCENSHVHTLDILANAAWCERERPLTAPSGLRCKPDVTLFNSHRQPCVLIEVRHTNQNNNTKQVAEELGVLWLEMNAPEPGSFQPELSESRNWWHMMDSISEEEKPKLDNMEALMQRLMDDQGSGERRWATLDRVPQPDGGFSTSFRFSQPKLAHGEFPTLGGAFLWANKCSLSCEEIQKVNQADGLRFAWDVARKKRWDLINHLGEAVFEALCKAGEQPAEFTVPIGTQEIHIKVALSELTQIGGGKPLVIDVRKLVEEIEADYEKAEAGLKDLLSPPSP